MFDLIDVNRYNTFSSQGTENPPFRFFWDTRYSTYIDLLGAPLFSPILLCTPQDRFLSFSVPHKFDGVY